MTELAVRPTGTLGRRPVISFELFPARAAEPTQQLHEALDRLREISPDYVSITCKPGLKSFEQVLDIVDHVQSVAQLRPLVHLACTAASRQRLVEAVDALLDRGVRGFLALRGDHPVGHDPREDELPFARYLVELIRDVADSRAAALAAGGVSVGVAAYARRHPESPSMQHDIEVLVSKQRSGADFAITQVVWDVDEYVDLVDRARRAGVRIPIIPGIMPTSDPLRVLRIQELTGVPVPREFMHALVSAGSDRQRHEVGTRVCAALMKACLAEGAPGLHLFTFNRHEDALRALERAGMCS